METKEILPLGNQAHSGRQFPTNSVPHVSNLETPDPPNERKWCQS